MKPFLCLFASTLCIFVLVLRIEKLESQNQLLQTESDILRDQVDDMAFQNAQLLSRRTYEEGLKDGIENSQISDYTRGYHAAINQTASAVTLSPEQSVTSN
jgi:hypothetical protein